MPIETSRGEAPAAKPVESPLSQSERLLGNAQKNMGALMGERAKVADILFALPEDLRKGFADEVAKLERQIAALPAAVGELQERLALQKNERN